MSVPRAVMPVAYGNRTNSASFTDNMSAGLVVGQRYRLIEELGRGGMGSVWRAVDLELDAPAAVKLIEPDLMQSSEAVARFKREAKAAASIRSTHVVQILGYGVDNGQPYIAMELLKGESLAARLEQAGKLTPEFTLTILTHVGRALALAHEHGIVHRDLKPDNIFLVREMDQCIGKVLDFGVARHRGGLGDSGGLKTKTGAVLGTPYYMSPEQATGKDVDHLTDIWSFGVIATECITGARPFESDSIGGLFSAICMEPMPVPSQLGSVPAGFDAWFAQIVARDKGVRFQSIQEAVAKLELVCGRPSGRPSAVSIPVERGDTVLSSGVAAPPAAAGSAGSMMAVGMQTTSAPSSRSVHGLPKPSRNSAALVAAVVTALVLVGLFVGWRWMHGPDAAPSAASIAGSASAMPLPSQDTQAQPSQMVPAPPPIALAPAANVAPTPSNTAEQASTRDKSKSTGPALHQKPHAVEPHASAPVPTSTAAAKTLPAAPQPSPAKPAPTPTPKNNDRLGI